MPLDPDEAEAFRDRARQHQETFWCGHLLGGCGGQLSLKIIHERETVPHFAHRADSNLCARLREGGEGTRGGYSADHLYAQRHLRTWLGERAVNTQAQYVGLAKGRACTELVVPTVGKPLRLVFTHDLDRSLLDLAKSAEAHDYVWLVRANQAVTRALVANGVPYRLFRLTDGDDHTRTVQVGIRDGAGEVVWTPLGECVLQADTLVKARTEAAPVPVQRRPEPREVAAPADPLEQALSGLRHVLDAQDLANVRSMAGQVQMRLRQARNRGLAPHLLDEARTLLQQASDALPSREVVARPRRAPVVPERRRGDGRRTLLPYQHVRREADKYLGKLQWAAERGLDRAYNDNRAALVGLLTRPGVPKDVTDQIKQQLRQFPKDQFDRPVSAPPDRKPRRAAAPEGRDRGRGANSGRRTDRIRARADDLLDTLQWAYQSKMPQTYDDTRAQLTDLLGRSSTPRELKDKLRAHLRRLPDSLSIRPVPAPAPPPKKPQESPKPDRRSRRGGKPAPRRQAPGPSHSSDAGILANARIDERSRRLLEQLRDAPQPPTPDRTQPER
ncbi:hypothetical protein [Nocardiopsis aegyptia]|uniref:Uncharacterized protein n=1 Tax=Nocardiopsis aegyptia TaxID=220378 RepID=A0A7Z0EIY2_9ACTN|nr:hypothetical protein [Nocardiopsis aegyptia]NYJ32832.1 hypothetical protein [Nocardiopsis aegyptia]